MFDKLKNYCVFIMFYYYQYFIYFEFNIVSFNYMMGLPDLMIDLVGCGLVTTLDKARQMSLMIDGVA